MYLSTLRQLILHDSFPCVTVSNPFACLFSLTEEEHNMHSITVKSILSPTNGMNLYRGCSHGCIYCDSRSSCYQMDHDFEDIAVKANALELLEAALKSRQKRCMIGTGSMSDPYLPLEAELGHTRAALQLICKYGFGVSLLTKSALVLRDLDVLSEINAQTKCVVQMTLTTYDESLCRILEPRVSTTRQRFEALLRLRDAGIPTVVWLCPLLPYLNDTEENLTGILDYCREAGVQGVVNFGMGLTLREGNREYFYAQLDRYFPGLKERYIREFGNRYEINSPKSETLWKLFHARCEEMGCLHNNDEIFRYLNAFEDKRAGVQLSLFGEV